MRHLLLLLSILGLLSSEARAQPEVVPGQVIVRWRGRVSPAGRVHLAGRRVVRATALGGGYWLYHLEERSGSAAVETARALEGQPEVDHVEPNMVRRLYRTPNDTHWALQWHLRAIRLEQGWDRTTGSREIVVAVVDSGVRPHPDLSGRLLPGYDFVREDHGGDGDGPDGNPYDEGGLLDGKVVLHGLHMAGIIGAATDNERGIAGVDWACQILPVRAVGVDGLGGNDEIADAIRWAAGLPVPGAPLNTTPARVINLSLGSPGYSGVLAEAIAAARAAGAIVVAAAGNGKNGVGVDVRGEDHQNGTFPAGLRDVIAVGATDQYGGRAGYSNFGEDVEVMAPGGDMTQQLPFVYEGKHRPAGIFSTLQDTEPSAAWGYEFGQGTSPAAAVVSGVVALMLSINPKLDLREATRILQATADPAGTCAEGCGAGLVNARRALEMTTEGSGLRAPQSNAIEPGTIVGGCVLAPGAPCPTGASLLCLGILAGLLLRRRRN